MKAKVSFLSKRYIVSWDIMGFGIFWYIFLLNKIDMVSASQERVGGAEGESPQEGSGGNFEGCFEGGAVI